ncbi:transmembrane channel-like protein 7 isoform X2 [Ixodes scapularis]|uniref:transmembrane channel-like protein 7 isoform X2 n=1 Tax=Ixodes scapularis TaxID=6945 RepID=UPI001A9E71A1|nr:transmembrane channel-like protein 7 isoform X2 [Ixodes scapularis]
MENYDRGRHAGGGYRTLGDGLHLGSNRYPSDNDQIGEQIRKRRFEDDAGDRRARLINSGDDNASNLQRSDRRDDRHGERRLDENGCSDWVRRSRFYDNEAYDCGGDCSDRRTPASYEDSASKRNTYRWENQDRQRSGLSVEERDNVRDWRQGIGRYEYHGSYVPDIDCLYDNGGRDPYRPTQHLRESRVLLGQDGRRSLDGSGRCLDQFLEQSSIRLDHREDRRNGRMSVGQNCEPVETDVHHRFDRHGRRRGDHQYLEQRGDYSDSHLSCRMDPRNGVLNDGQHFERQGDCHACNSDRHLDPVYNLEELRHWYADEHHVSEGMHYSDRRLSNGSNRRTDDQQDRHVGQHASSSEPGRADDNHIDRDQRVTRDPFWSTDRRDNRRLSQEAAVSAVDPACRKPSWNDACQRRNLPELPLSAMKAGDDKQMSSDYRRGKRAPLTLSTFCPSGQDSGVWLEFPDRSKTSLDAPHKRRMFSMSTMGSQKFTTMRDARKIGQMMGMAEDEVDAERRDKSDVVEEYGGRVTRGQWAKRNQLEKTPRQPGDQFDTWDFKSMKAMKKASEMSKDITGWLSMWSSSLKTIEGHFGTGVASYFLFLRWLLLLNMLMFLMPALLVIVPHWVFPTMPRSELAAANSSTPDALPLPSPMAHSAVAFTTSFPFSTVTALPSESEPSVKNRTLQLVQECYESYHKRVSGQTKEGISQLQDFLQGTGWMELTALFVGRYLNSVDHVPGTTLSYNFPLAYVLANVGCFLLCLLLMVQYTRKGVREALLLSEGKLHRYCNLVFASWDFCITDQRTARLKHISIIQELKSDLAEERRNMEIARWSRGKEVGLFVVRLVANVVVVAVVAASLLAVYQATSFSFEQSQEQHEEGAFALVVQFVPSLVITGLNLVVPLLFSLLIRYENYSVGFQVKLNLLRTVFLRFTSIFVLLLSLDRQINCPSSSNQSPCLEGKDESCKKPLCWETAVGQQIYKLTILDFLVSVALVFVLECPRKFLVTRFDCRLTRLIGQQEFNIPNRVLDLVYSQTLCWLGTFYCPLLPAISIIKYFIIFYVQKFTLMHNSQPSQTPYRASRSNTFFVVVLLMALFLAVMPFAYALVEIPPSLACGPFQRFGATWDVVRFTVRSWGWPLVDIVNFFTSVAFAVPAVVVLAITVYYYWSVSAAHVHMEKALKDKLVLEGKDKQFLLARITEVARQQTVPHPS